MDGQKGRRGQAVAIGGLESEGAQTGSVLIGRRQVGQPALRITDQRRHVADQGAHAACGRDLVKLATRRHLRNDELERAIAAVRGRQIDRDRRVLRRGDAGAGDRRRGIESIRRLVAAHGAIARSHIDAAARDTGVTTRRQSLAQHTGLEIEKECLSAAAGDHSIGGDNGLTGQGRIGRSCVNSDQRARGLIISFDRGAGGIGIHIAMCQCGRAAEGEIAGGPAHLLSRQVQTDEVPWLGVALRICIIDEEGRVVSACGGPLHVIARPIPGERPGPLNGSRAPAVAAEDALHEGVEAPIVQ